MNKVHSNTATVNTITLAAIGIFLGNLAGLSFVIGMDDTLSQQIITFLIHVFHAPTLLVQFYASLQDYILTFLLGVVISPVIMSVIARTWIILWGMVPTVVFSFWTTADYMADNSIKFSLFQVVASFFLLNLQFVLIGVALSFVVYAIKRHCYIKANG